MDAARIGSRMSSNCTIPSAKPSCRPFANLGRRLPQHACPAQHRKAKQRQQQHVRLDVLLSRTAQRPVRQLTVRAASDMGKSDDVGGGPLQQPLQTLQTKLGSKYDEGKALCDDNLSGNLLSKMTWTPEGVRNWSGGGVKRCRPICMQECIANDNVPSFLGDLCCMVTPYSLEHIVQPCLSIDSTAP